MTTKKTTPGRAQSSTSAHTTNRPATSSRPKHAAASDKKGSKKRKAEGKGEAPDKAALDYAQKAYAAALEHYCANKGNTFARSRLAVVFEESKPGDTHIVVTLPGFLRDSHVGDEDVRGWIKDAELFARTLAHPKCDEAFRRAFGAIYTDEMLQGSGVDWMTPEAIRVMFPLLMIAGSGTNHVCDDEKARDILILLHSEFVNEETDREVRGSLGMQ